MSEQVARLLDALAADPWRTRTGFSADLEGTQRQILGADAARASGALGEWLQRSQPCLFGRAAAALGALHYCVLVEDDLTGTDEHIRDKIQDARLGWRRAAIDGRASGFVILAASEKICGAVPDSTMLALAKRLLALYLLREVHDDEVYHDDLLLQVPTPSPRLLHWRVGSNYFCAQGDNRWWHDHRVPGGMAFSMNSVGHLVKSRLLATGLAELAKRMGLEKELGDVPNIDSLPKALVFAMKTIDGAAETVSGRATELLPREPAEDLPKYPTSLPAHLASRNHCKYRGWYHTDVTLPSEYFRANVARPTDVISHELDLTYLFHDVVDNPDYWTMGEGVPFKDAGLQPLPHGSSTRLAKSVGRVVPVEEEAKFKSELLSA